MALLKIFISYATEDLRIAEAVRLRLGSAFLSAVNIISMSQFQLGINWRNEIDAALDKSDILLVIAGGHKKFSHSFTGYEVGFFRKSQQTRKYVDDVIGEQKKLERLIIPIAIFADIPDPVKDIQSIGFSKDDSFLFDLGSGGYSDADGKFYDLLSRIDNILDDLDPAPRDTALQKQIEDKFRDEATKFNSSLREIKSSICTDIKGPPCHFTLQLPAEFIPKEMDIDDRVLIASSGSTAGMFVSEQPQQAVTWSVFAKGIDKGNKPGIVQNWNDAFYDLVDNAYDSLFVDSKQVAFAYDEEKLYHLYAAELRTYMDLHRELDIYPIKVETEKLVKNSPGAQMAKALAVALTYRTLFLEKDSPYGEDFKFCSATMRKSRIGDLLRDVRSLIVQSREAGIGGQSYCAHIWIRSRCNK
jgi:hypothetical protein